MRNYAVGKFKKQFRPYFFLIVTLIFFRVGPVYSSQFLNDTEKLLSRIDLSANELEKVKQLSSSPDKAAAELLDYFRKRNSVKHFIDRSQKENFLGKAAGEKDLEMADNALNHIFVGQSAYPPYFCGDNIDWGTRPVADNEWVWQLNRMYFWNAMAKAYWHTGDEKYAREWCAQLVDWTVKNTNDNDHKYAWRSIEAGIRGHSWTELFQYFIDSPNFTPEVLVAFLNSMFDHADYLMTVYRSKSNWGLMEAEGMAFIAITFPEFKDAVKWRTEAFRRLNNEINLQVYPDGHQRELAIGYHLGCINWFLRTFELAKMNQLENMFPPSYLKTIELMCEVPMKLGHPDGTNAQFGDAWAGSPGQHTKRYLEWAEKFKRDDFLFLATNGEKGQEPDSTAYALPESGLYSMRSSWDNDAICLVLKCGPDGGGHCQPDNGTFELFAGGRNLMPDAGSFIYSGDPEGRRWFRQTKVHQTLTLNGENSKYAPKLVLWQPGEKLDILVVENQSYENLAHRRSVFFVDKRYFVIVDEAIGTATGTVDVHFQLAPGKVSINSEDLSVNSDFSDGWNVHVKANTQKDIQLLKEEGQVSFLYTKKEPRPAFCYSLEKLQNQDKVRFVTLVAPYESEVPDIKIQFGNSEIPGLQLNVNEGGVRKEIGYSL
ncbi:alginate lyase family protein [Maribellus sp. YY47]|uniref:alginate lyase family protein n=1 Tax=Maribellus sp. YY47 TaxID=2929486 RepID=UPI0020011071|nr:alginate lyase family protein [Maribellus sp. YY47]MCK3685344.1 heparinase II/III family protein [Maribellus sp. YY47]